MSKMERVGDWIVFDWYDGPLREARLVTCSDGDKLAEVRTFAAGDVEESRGAKVVRVRLDREDLQRMLDMLDGKPVVDFFDEEHRP